MWWKPDFKKFDPDHFEALLPRVVQHLNDRNATLYVTDVFCGADPEMARPYRFVGEYATHAYFCNIMFPKKVRDDDDRETEGWTLLNVPSFRCDPERDGTPRRAGGHHRRPQPGGAGARPRRLLRRQQEDDVHRDELRPAQGRPAVDALLGQRRRATATARSCSASRAPARPRCRPIPERELIGDDEHVWGRSGISNFEDGCYAKLIDLNKEAEPVIAAALSMPGTLIENVPPLPGQRIEETHPQDLDLMDGIDHREHAVRLPARRQPQRGRGRQRTASANDRAAHRRRVRRAAPGLDPHRGRGDVPLRHRVHVQAGRHRGGHHRAAGHVQCVFRRSVHVAQALGLRRAAGDRDGAARDPLRAAQHRLVAAARTAPATASPSATPACCSTRRCTVSSTTKTPSSTPSSTCACPSTAPASRARSSIPATPGTTPRRYDAAALKLRDMFRENYEAKGFAELGIKAVM